MTVPVHRQLFQILLARQIQIESNRLSHAFVTTQCMSQWFGQIIGWIDHPRDVCHCNAPVVLPILDCKELHISVP